MHSETIDALKKADRNKIALLASVLPGAGHILKGHKTLGATLLLGNILMAFVAGWLALATVGVSLLVVPILWFGGVAASAYLIPDLTGHTAPHDSSWATRWSRTNIKTSTKPSAMRTGSTRP